MLQFGGVLWFSYLMETLLILSLIFAPLAFASVEPWALALLQLVVFSFSAHIFFNRKPLYPAILYRNLLPAVLALAFIGLMQSIHENSVNAPSMFIFTAWRPATLNAVLLWLFYAAVIFTVPQIIQTPVQLKRLMWIVFIMGVMISIFGMFQKSGENTMIYGARYVKGEPFGPFINRNHAATFLIMLLGLSRHVLLQVSNLILRKGRRLVNVPWNRVLEDTLTWALPFRHLIPGTMLFSSVSFLFHIGVIIVPLFLADHVLLCEKFLGTKLPAISQSLADYLSLLTIGCLMTLLALRLLMRRLRAMSRKSDYVLLIMVALPFLTGFVSSHPELNPLPWKLTMLLHLLSAETLFLIIPFTKLAHIVLFPFDRISVLHWQLRPGAGDKVAQALYGEEVRI